MAYHIAPGCMLRLGVNNLLDKDPPVNGLGNGTFNTYPSNYDALGRALYAKFSLSL
jgi:outer membrane receptor protein involved in Fe transport